MVEAGGAPTETEHAAAGGESANVDATTVATGDKELVDLPDFFITDVDRMMDGAFGDHVHQNDGTHLMGGIADDAVWQARFNSLIAEQPTI